MKIEGICPKCGYSGATSVEGPVSNADAAMGRFEVFCEYDCGSFMVSENGWRETQDNYD